MTYLEIVNRVLRRLREPQVDSLTANTYSTLIADLVNEVKRDVENSWNWSALRTTLTATTTTDLFNYVLTGTGTTLFLGEEVTTTAQVVTGLEFRFTPNPNLTVDVSTTITVYGNETGGSQTIPVIVTYKA